MSGPHDLVEPHPRLAGRRVGPLVMLLALTIVQVGATSAAGAHEPGPGRRTPFPPCCC